MSELDIISSLSNLGGTVILGAILGIILYCQQKNVADDRHNSEKRFEGIINSMQDMVRADQQTRERHTKALISMYESIDRFNQVNGLAQQDCRQIRESLSIEINNVRTELSNAKNVTARCEVIQKRLTEQNE